jgi:hypothetical protein
MEPVMASAPIRDVFHVHVTTAGFSWTPPRLARRLHARASGPHLQAQFPGHPQWQSRLEHLLNVGGAHAYSYWPQAVFVAAMAVATRLPDWEAVVRAAAGGAPAFA